MVLAPGNVATVYDVLNAYHTGGNVIIGKEGSIRFPVIINNDTGLKNVYLYLRGMKTGAFTNMTNHGIPEHTHTATTTATSGASSATVTVNNVGTNIVADTAVPKAVQILIDGTIVTTTIGDPNGKGATMYAGSTHTPLSAEITVNATGATLYYTQNFDKADVASVTFNLRADGSATGVFGYVIFYYSDATNSGATTTRNVTGTTNNDFTENNPQGGKMVTKIEFYAYQNGSGSEYITPKTVTFDSSWGVDGTTEWDTGRLDLSSVISWTAGEHYIELKEHGMVGGTLIYQVCVNTGY